MGRNLIFVLVLGVLGLFLLWMNSPTHLDAELSNPDAGYPNLAKRKPSQAEPHQTSAQKPEKIEPLQRPKKEPSRIPASVPILTPQMNDLKDLALAALQEKWKLWDHITAVENQVAENNSSMQVIGRVNGFALVKTENEMSFENFDASNPIVLFDERLQSAGVVTGTVSFNLKNNGELNDVMNDYALKMVQSFSHMNLYYVTSNSVFFDLNRLFSTLGTDARLENVTLEVLSKNYEKK